MTEQKKVPIRNFHPVNDWLYRGGQPGADGIASLAEMGVRTVVSFRWGAPTIDAERSRVESSGMKFVSIRLSYWHLPTERIIEDFLAVLDEESNRPIFVHCLHGADRTGLLIAIFRMAREKWSVEEAYAEMKRHGFHRFRLRNFKWMLWKYSRTPHQSSLESTS